ncbi:MAG TPA: YaiO family outer membrane beta-barrel protein [Gemmatimonadales bacterium]|nr:YaiO family outer membrane beta-barrel protein [Gemmatimonadales bacterium]
MLRSRVLWVMLGCTTAPAVAQTSPTPPSSFVEAGAFYHRVTHDFGDWKGAYARAVLLSARNVWYLDARAQEAFRDRGVYASLANVHTFSPRVYTQLAAGAGSGKFALPDYRFDASLNLKLGRAKALILTTGGSYVRSKSVYKDKALFGSLSWYASPTALLELGGRLNWSDPNAVRSERASGALTLGRTGTALLTLRAGAGTEGYQLVGAAQTLQRFRSQEASAVLREWLSRHVGAVLGGEWYHNPFYTRAGVSLGLFYAW